MILTIKNTMCWYGLDTDFTYLFAGDLAAAIHQHTDIHFGLYHSLFEWFNPLYLEDKAAEYKTQKFVQVVLCLKSHWRIYLYFVWLLVGCSLINSLLPLMIDSLCMDRDRLLNGHTAWKLKVQGPKVTNRKKNTFGNFASGLSSRLAWSRPCQGQGQWS